MFVRIIDPGTSISINKSKTKIENKPNNLVTLEFLIIRGTEGTSTNNRVGGIFPP